MSVGKVLIVTQGAHGWRANSICYCDRKRTIDLYIVVCLSEEQDRKLLDHSGIIQRGLNEGDTILCGKQAGGTEEPCHPPEQQIPPSEQEYCYPV